MAGIPGFLGNLDDLYETADVEGQAWREFVAVWWPELKRAPVRVSQLNELCDHHDLMLAIRGADTVKSQETRLGLALQDARDCVFNTFRVCLVWDKGKHGKAYALKPTLASVNESASEGPHEESTAKSGGYESVDSASEEGPPQGPH